MPVQNPSIGAGLLQTRVLQAGLLLGKSPSCRVIAKLALVGAVSLGLANCSTKPSGPAKSRSSEIGAFSDPKYGKASPRVVGEDETAPKGGGRFQVGKPYTIAGKTYVPREKPTGYTASGNASWYGIAFHGRKTANGEIYDRNSVSAAHPTMPLPSYARVTNLRNNHSIVVRVNDRGPYHGGRVMDVSERTAHLLNFKHMGTTRVKIDYLGSAALAGSDDARLVASLRTNGPAPNPGITASPVMVASAQPLTNAPVVQPQTLSFSAREPELATPFSRQVEPSEPVSRAPLMAAPGMPKPPQRPFDLETIAGAATPVAPHSLPVSPPVPVRGMILPPVRPTAFSFGPSDSVSRFSKDHPFSKLNGWDSAPRS
jgi:rare lipoprotein A